MFDICEQEIIRFHRNKNPFCIMMSDIDHFKKIKDQYGHAAGDHILIEYSKIQEEIRSFLNTTKTLQKIISD